MEIFYNATHLWSSICYKLCYARSIMMTCGINCPALIGFRGGWGGTERLAICGLEQNPICAMFNVTIFIILKAYAGMATDDEASCWQSGHRCIFFVFLGPFVIYFIFFTPTRLIKTCAKLFVTFVKVFCCTRAQRLAVAATQRPKACMHMQSSAAFNVFFFLCPLPSPPRPLPPCKLFNMKTQNCLETLCLAGPSRREAT